MASTCTQAAIKESMPAGQRKNGASVRAPALSHRVFNTNLALYSVHTRGILVNSKPTQRARGAVSASQRAQLARHVLRATRAARSRRLSAPPNSCSCRWQRRGSPRRCAGGECTRTCAAAPAPVARKVVSSSLVLVWAVHVSALPLCRCSRLPNRIPSRTGSESLRLPSWVR